MKRQFLFLWAILVLAITAVACTPSTTEPRQISAEEFDLPPAEFKQVSLRPVQKEISAADLTEFLYVEDHDDNSGPAGGATYMALRDAEGQIWFATHTGVARFDGESWHNDSLFDGQASSALALLDDGSIVASGGSLGGGFYRYEAGKWNEAWTEHMDNLEYCCWSWPMAVGPGEDLWLGDITYHAEGVRHFDGAGWQFFQFDEDKVTTYNLTIDEFGEFIGNMGGWLEPGDPALSIAIDPDGAAWIATSGGLARYDDQEWTSPMGDDYLPGDIAAVAQGPDGSLWFHGSQGFAHFDGRVWTTYALDDVNPGLAEGQYQLYSQANYIATAKDGDVWFTGAEGPYHFDGETLTMYSLDLDVYNEPAWSFGTPIVVDGDGALWLAGSYQGIYRFTPPVE